MTARKPRVTEAPISYARSVWDIEFVMTSGGSARADLLFDDGTTDTLGWYHDEISFSTSDFVGKTMEQIRRMHYERDMQYLRS